MTQTSIPHDLQTAIHENKLLIFIGAGLSKFSGIPLWKDIVIKTLQNPSIEKREGYINAIESDVLTPLEALDKIKTKHRKEIYTTFENETSITVESPIYDKIYSISGKLITTNYDKLIENNCNIPVISTNSAYSLQKIDENKNFLLKIHGDCSEIDNAVIFTSDYTKLYENQDGFAKFQLEKLVSSHTCLFIGFSMRDNYVSHLFDRLHAMYQGLGREHYAISTEELSHATIKTITIDSYDKLPEIIDQLHNIKATQKTKEYKNKDFTPPQKPLTEDSTRDIEDGIALKIGSDTPPITENWAGRSEELRSLKSQHKVCFITGIGGQGKSALASRLLLESSRENYDLFDWRDFKEEELNFQSKLYQLIETVSKRSILTKTLIGLETEELVNIFFNELGQQKGIFVFDNIDKYIDLEKFTPTGDIEHFFLKALKTQHYSKFVFTCRPFIHHASIGFYQVKLEGLQLDDVKELIKKYHPQITDIDLVNYSSTLHSTTQGHPLWMGLILAQSRTRIQDINGIIKKISAHHDSRENINLSAIISKTILEDVWHKLKERERVILRTLSISSIAEKEDDLAKIVENKLKYNQFSKAMKSLRSFNLIIEKEGNGYIELHPLVREFIKANYAREQQENYIALYVNYLDGFICLIKSKFGRILDPDDIELLIKKIEILINSDKYADAINELRTAGDSIKISGYCEEFIRLCDLLLSRNIWSTKKISAINGFNDFIFDLFSTTANFGRHDLFDKYINEYSKIFPNADKNMILIKSSLCYREWTRGNFNSAIKEGKSASDLIEILGGGDVWEGLHRYNLALRDSDNTNNIKLAMKFFCKGKSLDYYLTSPLLDEDSAETYGNTGRCLTCLNENEKALLLISKSYKKLKNEGASLFNNHNIGYAAKWIHEILIQTEKLNDALYFLLYARNIWEKDLPVEANKLDQKISKFPKNSAIHSITSLESWQISKFCDDYIESIINKKKPPN
ncbi:SIR2 family protein [Azovibrio restrictus]|uniref:SIR2 family protein n=1 Tax=Azovibrio restrictus TaxID=146938 RepID=UPI0026EDF694|nr:SIR2 family protein [Azovibrio restrictus]MDD3481315.1 SIR2 family protein [Azovibrio restrictus]